MTSVTERIPLDRIEDRARHAHPGRVLLTLLAAALFALGWLTCKAFAVAWLGGSAALPPTQSLFAISMVASAVGCAMAFLIRPEAKRGRRRDGGDVVPIGGAPA